MLHRIGGSSIDNLRLKPLEERLSTPGISVLEFATPDEAAVAIRTAFPKATKLHVAARTIASATAEAIWAAGFDVLPNPSETLPTHHRIVHANGASGFSDQNLARLATAFVDTTGH